MQSCLNHKMIVIKVVHIGLLYHQLIAFPQILTLTKINFVGSRRKNELHTVPPDCIHQWAWYLHYHDGFSKSFINSRCKNDYSFLETFGNRHWFGSSGPLVVPCSAVTGKAVSKTGHGRKIPLLATLARGFSPVARRRTLQSVYRAIGETPWRRRPVVGQG